MRLNLEWYAVRDVLLVMLGIFMLLHETLTAAPDVLIVGAAFGVIGLPVPLHLDQRAGHTKDK
jgi:uncharacterized membrane protein HdeD (DUF308 family)